jgi:FMN reductase [NAD(P)H]
VYIGTIFEFVPEVRQMFDLPEGVLPVVLLCFGYPKSRPQPRKKLPLDTIVHAEKYLEQDEQQLINAFREKYPDLKVAITDENLQTMRQVCETVHDKEFADACLQRIKEQGYINPVQRYFGLHYRADHMPEKNTTFMEWIELCGFKWFRKYQP